MRIAADRAGFKTLLSNDKDKLSAIVMCQNFADSTESDQILRPNTKAGQQDSPRWQGEYRGSCGETAALLTVI